LTLSVPGRHEGDGPDGFGTPIDHAAGQSGIGDETLQQIELRTTNRFEFGQSLATGRRSKSI
jgi:hypothetical protein